MPVLRARTAPPVSEACPPPDRQSGWVGPGRPGPRALAAAPLALPALALARLDLVLLSVARDLRARWRGSLLGMLWALVQPLLLFAVYAFLFTQVLGLRMVPAGASPAAAMGVYMFTGTVVWASFAEGVTRATSSVLDHRHLVAKVRFPSELLPLFPTLSAQVTLLLSLAAFVAATLVTPVWRAPGAALAWVPLLCLLQVAMGWGLGLFLAAAHVFVRDTLPFVTAALTAGMFATPIFWVPSPEALPGVERWLPLIEANPLYHLLYAWRAVLMSGEPASVFARPVAGSVAVFGAWALASLALGCAVFRRVQRDLADEV